MWWMLWLFCAEFCGWLGFRVRVSLNEWIGEEGFNLKLRRE